MDDQLIILCDQDMDINSLHLNGQTFILEDCLQARPERKVAVRRLEQEGKLHIGH
jgi:alpha-mannosidase